MPCLLNALVNQTDGVAEGENKDESLFDKAKEFANSEQGKKVIGQFEQQFGGEGGQQSDLFKKAQGFLGDVSWSSSIGERR